MRDWNYPFAKPHSWDKWDEYWYERYLELVQFKKEQGHCRVPKTWQNNKKLAGWVKTQRLARTKMVSWRKELLDALDFTWRLKPPNKSWDERYALLISFHRTHGHCLVKQSDQENRSLHNWVISQRQKYHRGLLTKEQISRLEQLGFKWRLAVPAIPWDVHYEKLLAFKRTFGHCNVSRGYTDQKLALWVKEQRKRKKENTLSTQRQDLLEEVGFQWKIDLWAKRYEKLKEFKEVHGHCRVAKTNRDPRWQDLVSWVDLQRRQYKKNHLTKRKITQLEQLGFSWNARQEIWQGYYEQLAAFQELHGHCHVNLITTTTQMLRYWVQYQRDNRENLSKEQIKLLKTLNFQWKKLDALEVRWMTNFEQLRHFQKQHGHCNVPWANQASDELPNWVNTQRQFFKRGKLTSYRIELLEGIGFEWHRAGKRTLSSTTAAILEGKWLDKFEQLKDFKKQQGHCNPTCKGPQKSLGEWVARQRANFRQKKISADRMKLLESIGFEWIASRKRKK